MATRPNFNLQQQYEDFKPLVEEKDTPDALLLLVHLPGFTREQVGANYEAAYKRIRVFGEKPLDNNKRIRFNVEHIIPEACDSDRVKGKFEGAVITITMPKKPISSVAPKETKPAQEAAKQVPPPASTNEVEAEGAVKRGEEGISKEQPKSEKESQIESDEKKDETPTQQEATGESKMPQKDKEEIPQNGTKEDEKHKDEMKEITDTSAPEKATGESRMPQKDQKGIPQEGTLDDEKHEETQRAQKEGIRKEGNGKTLEAGKAPQKVQFLAREESKKERKESEMVAAESSGLKTGKIDQRNYGKTVSESPIGKGIKDMANSASQAVTRLANRFNEEDKQKLLYAGAAILAVAIGIYASFKLRSMPRQ